MPPRSVDDRADGWALWMAHGPPPLAAGWGHETAPAHGGAPATGPPPLAAGWGHETAPVGGTTGAAGEPSSGGEKPVRQSLDPEGERVRQSCLIERCLRKSRTFTVDIALSGHSELLNPQICAMALECSTTSGRRGPGPAAGDRTHCADDITAPPP